MGTIQISQELDALIQMYYDDKAKSVLQTLDYVLNADLAVGLPLEAFKAGAILERLMQYAAYRRDLLLVQAERDIWEGFINDIENVKLKVYRKLA